MPEREKLQEVETTTPSGLKTTFRTRHPDRYRRMERAAQTQQQPPTPEHAPPAQTAEREEARTRARHPQARSGDVETK